MPLNVPCPACRGRSTYAGAIIDCGGFRYVNVSIPRSRPTDHPHQRPRHDVGTAARHEGDRAESLVCEP